MTGKVLGKGHFARVEEAVHNVLHTKVAIKIINVGDITDKYVKKNLKREAWIMSKILHPNIVCLFEVLETERKYYLVTELGTGGDLCTYVKSQHHGKLDERKSRPLVRQLVSAVAHLHEKGIVHRDLKMENILLDYTKEKIKLVDFGLSNICEPGELFKTHCGSPEYAAPELYISQRKYGAEIDIWSLGVIFYGMMIGSLPFQSNYKVGLTQQEKRKHLMEETKIGLTSKHTRALAECPLLFRRLLPKMLNPNSTDRISIFELQKHSWIHGTRILGFPPVDEAWETNVISKISKFLDLPLLEVHSRILKHPYGAVGGIYNIEKLSHLSNKLVTNSNCRNLPQLSWTAVKASCNLSQNIRPSSTSQERTECLRPGGNGRLRPKTSGTQNAAGDLQATTNMGHGDFNPKPTPSKMLNFINDKLYRTFGVGKHKDEGFPMDSSGTSRPKTVPSKAERKQDLEVIQERNEAINDSHISLHTENFPEKYSRRNSARTKFIRLLCSSNPDKDRQPVASPPPRPKTSNGYPKNGRWCSSETKPPKTQYRDSVPLSCKLHDASHQLHPAKQSSSCSKRFTSPKRDFSYFVTNVTPPGVPRHTAARAALRLASRSGDKSQIQRKY